MGYRCRSGDAFSEQYRLLDGHPFKVLFSAAMLESWAHINLEDIFTGCSDNELVRFEDSRAHRAVGDGEDTCTCY